MPRTFAGVGDRRRTRVVPITQPPGSRGYLTVGCRSPLGAAQARDGRGLTTGADQLGNYTEE